MKRTAKLALTFFLLALVSPLYAEAPPSVATPTAETETATDYSLVIDDQGDVSIPGTLTVSGSLEVPTIAGDSTTVTGDLTIDKNLSVTGTATLPTIGGDTTTKTGDLTVDQDLTVDGTLTAKGDVTIPGTLTVGTIVDEKTVSGGLIVDGTLRGPGFYIIFTDLGSTPAQCLQACKADGGRMATLTEMYGYAASGQDICSNMWVVDDTTFGEQEYLTLLKVAYGYPMYTNQTDSKGCGTENTGDVPRIINLHRGRDWDDSKLRNCGCYSLR